MSTRAKHLFLIILAQTICLAVGLWMQHHFVVSSATQAVEEQAWSDIDAIAVDFFSELEELALTDVTPGDAAVKRLTGLLSTHSPSLGEVTFVDPRWRIMLSSAKIAQTPTYPASPGAPIEWRPREGTSRNMVHWAQGRIALPDGVHIAVARALPGKQGHVLIHHPVAAIEAKSAALVRSVPAISVMTFLWTCALLSIAVYTILAHLHEKIDRQRSRSANDALQQTQNLIRTRDAVIFGLAKLAESRDSETGNHLERISVYSTAVASVLRRHPKFRNEVTPAFARLIGISSALHDIGKVGVEDLILRKPGLLTPGERATMQNHSAIGGECLREIEQRLGRSNFLQMAREIAFSHHENWDGTGYPKRLSGTAIPLSARIVAIADVYDALTSKRVYKEAFPHEKCVKIIRDDAGKKFDPELVEVWLTIEHKFRTIAQQLADRAQETVFHKPTDLPTDEFSEQEREDLYVVASGASNELS